MRREQIENELKKRREEEIRKQFNDYNARRIEIKNMYKTNNLNNENNFYDIIIKIKSLFELITNGWEIIYPSNNLNQQNINIPIISVIGEKKKGKSFLLNKLFNADFPHGFNINNKGISFKYLNIDIINFNIIETGDIEHSVTKEFIKEFVLSKSNIIFIVVEQLTFSEQMLLEKFYGFDYHYDCEEIIVIHNLYNFVKINQVQNYINNVLKKNKFLNLDERKIKEINNNDENENENNCFFVSFNNYNISNKTLKIKHVILANDSIESEAGDYYNYSTIQFLRNILQFNSRCPLTNFDLISELRHFIYCKINDYFENIVYPLNLNISENNNKKILKLENITELKFK